MKFWVLALAKQFSSESDHPDRRRNMIKLFVLLALGAVVHAGVVGVGPYGGHGGFGGIGALHGGVAYGAAPIYRSTPLLAAAPAVTKVAVAPVLGHGGPAFGGHGGIALGHGSLGFGGNRGIALGHGGLGFAGHRGLGFGYGGLAAAPLAVAAPVAKVALAPALGGLAFGGRGGLGHGGLGFGGHGGLALGHGGLGFGGHAAIAAPIAKVAAAPIYAHAPQPYEFGYNRQHEDGAHVHRQELSDGVNKKGSYGYTSPDGLYRQVDYIADELGYRANIKTNEPGTANQNPAAVGIAAEEPPYKVLPAPAPLIKAAVAVPAFAPAVVKAAVPVIGQGYGHGGFGHGGYGGHGVGLVRGGIGYGHGLARGVVGGYGLAGGVGYGHGGLALGGGYGLGLRGHGGFGHHG